MTFLLSLFSSPTPKKREAYLSPIADVGIKRFQSLYHTLMLFLIHIGSKYDLDLSIFVLHPHSLMYMIQYNDFRALMLAKKNFHLFCLCSVGKVSNRELLQ
jgi:hypothetical protein